ncbi:MAG TPA: transglutaminase-like domain-containing protein [Tepidisphaeraceae bacterium]|nr:transglutaminase-like domain-containing protein [Tepidisphaeraceae bacterium]
MIDGIRENQTNSDPGRAVEAVGAGRLAGAEQLLTSADAYSGELVPRLHCEYSLTPEDFLKKAGSSISSLTLADIRRWMDAGMIQHRLIDGRPMIFRREPANLFRFCPEAIARRTDAAVPAARPRPWLRSIIDEASATGRPEVLATHHHLRFTLRVHAGIPEMKRGSQLRAWLPAPQQYLQQKDVRLIGTCPAGGRQAANGSAHRTIYLEKTVEDPSAEQIFTAEYEFRTSACYPQLADELSRPASESLQTEYLAERLPHIPLTESIRKLAAEIVRGQTYPLAAARAIFRWVHENIRYCAEEEYCLISSLTEKALSSRRGDCGVQAMVFITLCRAAGIPARWQSGWRIEPGNINMHDWCEFYVAPWGWLPCDPSDGPQPSDDPAIRDFYFGHTDPYRMIVNLDFGRAFDSPKKSLRSEPVDFQRGEVEMDGRNLYFDCWDYELRRQT